MPNVKDKQKKPADLINDFVEYEQSYGQLVYDIEWEPGFFLKTFPQLFICKDLED